MNIKKALAGVRVKAGENIRDADIDGIADDSRKVRPGDLFVALKGYSTDASKFIGDALDAGARAVVTDKDFGSRPGVSKILVDDTRSALSAIAGNFYGHPSRKLKVIGITGTNGKTTISYLLESVLKASGASAGVIGTISYRLNGRTLPAVNTTPGALELQRMLSEMAASGTGYAVIEVSSHSLDQGRVEGILFDAGVFTNLTSDHLDYHKTVSNYFKAKKRLFDKLKTDGCAVLNIDDSKAASLRKSIKNRVMTYGVKGKADVAAADVALSMDGTRFTVRAPDMRFDIRTKLIGIHNVSNILAASSVAIALKVPEEAIMEGIASMERVPGRLEAVDAGQDFKVLVDFAHTEDALFNVLSLLKGLAKSRMITVFGCGGDRDRTKRPLMGKVACKYSDHVIVTSDNPRFEDPDAIIREIEKGIKGRFSNYDIIPDRKEAIAKALGLASKDDIVVLAGKGHEAYQMIRDEAIPFDDRAVALSILKRS
ncbi:MAG: UDP-N-acetylmuramoyl-L-alanyl-D-glutamate--2,6-diaminopimelate ligase [Candidatus Omnitrophota bacterium]